jgi:type II restriction enzyme
LLEFIKDEVNNQNIDYIAQANSNKLRKRWNINVDFGETSRNIDFAVNCDGRLYFIETNFYGGGGSKLKSTAGEYIYMSEYWNSQGIKFIWITDGLGWKSTLKALREYFDRAEYLLNLELIKKGALNIILKSK